MEMSGIAPATFRVNLVVLLPKPAGGDRPIALLSFLYASWVKCRRFDVAEWGAAHAGH